MAVKIIKPGRGIDSKRLFVCKCCGCEFEADGYDLRIQHDDLNEKSVVYYTNCPCCRLTCFSGDGIL